MSPFKYEKTAIDFFLMRPHGKVSFVSFSFITFSHVQENSVTLAVLVGISSEIPSNRTNISCIHAEIHPRISSEINPKIIPQIPPEITLPALQTILSNIYLLVFY